MGLHREASMSATLASWNELIRMNNKQEAVFALAGGMICAGYWWHSRKSQLELDATMAALRSELDNERALRMLGSGADGEQADENAQNEALMAKHADAVGKIEAELRDVKKKFAAELEASKGQQSNQLMSPVHHPRKEPEAPASTETMSQLEATLDKVFSFVAIDIGEQLATRIRDGAQSNHLTDMITEVTIKTTRSLEKTLELAWNVVDENRDGLLSKEENEVLVNSYLKCLKRWVPVVVQEGVDSMVDHLTRQNPSCWNDEQIQTGWRGNADLMTVVNKIKHHFTAGMTREVSTNRGACFGQTPDQIWAKMDANSDGQVDKQEFITKFLAAVRIVPTVVNTGSQAAKCTYDLVTDQRIGRFVLTKPQLNAEISTVLEKTQQDDDGSAAPLQEREAEL